jgi:hypothetical protein
MDAAPLGVVRDYDDLLEIARNRMAQLQITFETLDSVSGCQPGYCAKLLGPMPSKRLGAMSLPAVLGALGMKLIAVVDDEQFAQIRDRLVRSKRPRNRSSTTFDARPLRP